MKKNGERGLLQFEATYKAEIINTEEYLSPKYTADQFVNIFRTNVSNLPINNSTIQQEQMSQRN